MKVVNNDLNSDHYDFFIPLFKTQTLLGAAESEEVMVTGGSSGNDNKRKLFIISVPNGRSLSNWPQEPVCVRGELDLLYKRKNDGIFCSDTRNGICSKAMD